MGGSIANMSAMFRMEHEWIFVFGKERKPLNNTKKNKSAGLRKGISNRQRDGSTKKVNPKIVKDLGRISSVSTMCYGNSKEHPAVFPVNFPIEYIKAMTNNIDSIIDPFLGSGSTLIAAEKTNRKCYGMEIDPHYCDVIIKRWEDFTGLKAELIK
jgi:DNA modification methylase